MSHKKLGFWMLIALIVGNVVGSGVYLLPSTLATVGSISFISWIFTGLGAISLALVFGKVSALFPKTGGPYAYSREGFGDFIGFQCAFCYWLSAWIGNAAIAIACVGYLGFFFKALSNPFASFIVAAGLIWFFTYVNVTGIRKAGMMQSITTVLKLIPLLAVVIFGWKYFHISYLTSDFNVTIPHRSALSAISYAATLTLWGFLGIESATVPADSVENPKKNIGRSTVIATIGVAILYILSMMAVMGILPNELLQKSTSPFADASTLIFGHIGGIIIAIGAIISCLGALNGWILLQGQIAMAAAEDGLFPFANFFARKNNNGVPANATIMTSVLVTIILLVSMSHSLVEQFNFVILLATSIALFMYFYVAASGLLFMKTRLIKNTPFNICVFLFAIGYSFWAIFSAGPQFVYYEVMLLLGTFFLYVSVIRRQAFIPNYENHEKKESTTGKIK